MEFEDTVEDFRPGLEIPLFRSLRDSRQVEAVRALARLRGRRQGYLKMLHVWMLVPVCDACYWDRQGECFHGDLRDLYFEVRPGRWQQDLRDLGIPLRQVRRLTEDAAGRPPCNICHQPLSYGEENVYVGHSYFSDHFCLDSDAEPGRRPTRWMRETIYEAYGSRCFRCLAGVTGSDAEVDHIIPWSKGGATVLTNLQLLCRRCAELKGDREPTVEGRVLRFPLYLPPSDSYEGVIW